jgi:hypothetical protein
VKEIPLTRGYVAFVDEADYERVMAAGPWHARVNKQTGMVYARHNSYIKGSKPHKYVAALMHRLLLGLTDPKIDVDHRNRYGLDNQRHNLRVSTRSQNRANSNKQGRHGQYSSRHKGVSWLARLNKWQAYISANGRRIHLGVFTKELDAARAYDAAARKHFGDHAKCNLGTKKG